MSSRSGVRILVVDDDPFGRTAIAAMLESRGFDHVKTAPGVVTAMECLGEFHPDVVIVDLDLGEGPNGIDLVDGLRRREPDLRIVVLSTYESPRLLGSNAGRLPADVTYLVKSMVTSAEVLVAAVEGVTDRPSRVVPDFASHKLSDTHIEILRLVARGLSNAEIGSRLVVSERTVEKSIARLIKILQIPADKTQNQRVMLAQMYLGMAGVVKGSSSAI